MPEFTTTEWQDIHSTFDASGADFGLPARRSQSVVIGTFNIRKLGTIKNRPDQAWDLLKKTCERFDLLAVQEVMDDLAGLEYLHSLLGDKYGLVVSDVTGKKPGSAGNAERLAYLFRWDRVQRTAMASDITYDRTEIANNLYDNSIEFDGAWKEHAQRIGAWEEKKKQKQAEGKKAPSKPGVALPRFVSFIRQPHYVSFRIPGTQGADPYEFMVVNAHLLYGDDPKEREWEFDALIEWLTVRAKMADKLYHRNLLLLGDCNLDFDSSTTVMRDEIDSRIKAINKQFLASSKAATANFPMLTPHPTHGVLRTALRQKQTYDQIGFFSRDSRLPTPDDNDNAGATANGYDYGVFNLADMIAQAIHGKSIHDVTASQRKKIYQKSEYKLSDHMPAWVRLPRPS